LRKLGFRFSAHSVVLIFVATIVSGCMHRLVNPKPSSPEIIRQVLARNSVTVEDHQAGQTGSDVNLRELRSYSGFDGAATANEQLNLEFPECEVSRGYFERPWWKAVLSTVTVGFYPFDKILDCSATLRVLSADGHETKRFSIKQQYRTMAGMATLGDPYGWNNANRMTAVEMLFTELLAWRGEKVASPAVETSK